MRKIWKWILGIVIVLVVVAAAGYAVRGFYVFRMARVERFSNFRPPTAQGFDRDNQRAPSFGGDRSRAPQGFYDHRMPMYGSRSFGGYGFMPMPFLFFGGFLRLIVPLAILAAVGYFAYRKGKKDGLAEAVAVTPMPAAPIHVEEIPSEPVEAPKRRRRKTEENEKSE